MAIVAACEVDAGRAVTAADIQHSMASLNAALTSTMIEEIELGLFRRFVSAQEQTVVDVVTPESAIDPCKRVVVLADCVGGHHSSEAGFVYTMLFSDSKLHAKKTRRFPGLPRHSK